MFPVLTFMQQCIHIYVCVCVSMLTSILTTDSYIYGKQRPRWAVKLGRKMPHGIAATMNYDLRSLTYLSLCVCA